MKLLAKTRRGTLPDRRGSRGRSSALPRGAGSRSGRIDPFPLGAHDVSGPPADPGEALRAGARRSTPCSRPLIGSWPAARRSSCSCPAIPASASPRLSMSCTSRSFRRAVSSRRANSTSTNATSRMPRSPRPSRTLVRSDPGRERCRSSAVGRTRCWRRVGPNGQLIVNLIPELEFVIGKQPPVPELAAAGRAEPLPAGVPAVRRACSPGRSIRSRCSSTICSGSTRQLSTCSSISITEPEVAAPATGRRLPGQRGQSLASADADAWRRSARPGANVQDIVLVPLGLDDVGRLVADSLHCEPDARRAARADWCTRRPGAIPSSQSSS